MTQVLRVKGLAKTSIDIPLFRSVSHFQRLESSPSTLALSLLSSFHLMLFLELIAKSGNGHKLSWLLSQCVEPLSRPGYRLTLINVWSCVDAYVAGARGRSWGNYKITSFILYLPFSVVGSEIHFISTRKGNVRISLTFTRGIALDLSD